MTAVKHTYVDTICPYNCSTPCVLDDTPYAFDKKTANFAQGLDFLRFLMKNKLRKTEEKPRNKNYEISGNSGSTFLIKNFLI